nr:MAG TPA: hypothetical protein [Caudoviricetes sp.]
MQDNDNIKLYTIIVMVIHWVLRYIEHKKKDK